MKNFKKLFIIVLSILTIALVSCRKTTETTSPTIPEGPTTPEEKKFKLIDIVGTYTNSVDSTTFKVEDNGDTATITRGNHYVTIPSESWKDKKNNETSSFFYSASKTYDVTTKETVNVRYYFNFSIRKGSCNLGTNMYWRS